MHKLIVTLVIGICTLSLFSHGLKGPKREYSPQRYSDDDDPKYLMPGLGFATFRPNYRKEFGNYNGLQVEYLFVANNRNEIRNSKYFDYLREEDEVSPGSYRFYGKLALLGSDKAGQNKLFTMGAGVDFSFENQLQRNWAIPLFGIEAGFIRHKQLGNDFVITPLAGMRIFNSRNFYVTALAGMPFALGNYENYRGFQFSLSANFSTW
ncbi:MAG: hypothetical protein JNL57_14005 [Bacteroidetes bacterium]|nr:hypothetical protein [Bacteroidota bacterium]